jgi:hypothetical protein
LDARRCALIEESIVGGFGRDFFLSYSEPCSLAGVNGADRKSGSDG